MYHLESQSNAFIETDDRTEADQNRSAELILTLCSRSRRQLGNKESQFGFSAESVDEPPDLDAAIAYYQLDEANEVFPPLSVRDQNL